MTIAEPLAHVAAHEHRQAPAAASKPSFYRPELDALRFFAFMAVFCAHVMPRSPDFYARNHLPIWLGTILGHAAWAGMGGVVLFFMLSSYLITGLLLREHNKTGRIDLMAFYKRRALRIWPLYFSFLAFAVFIAPHIIWPRLPLGDLLGFATFTENWGFFSNQSPVTPALPLWSLSVEEQFYLLWPLIVILFGVCRMWVPAILCIPTAAACRWYMTTHGSESLLTGGTGEHSLWAASTSHIDSIAVGALIAYFCQNGLPKIRSVMRIALIALGVAIPILVRQGVPEVWRYPAVTIACALILLGAIGFNLPRNKATDALVYLGKISFGLYVVHVTFIVYFDHLLPKVLFVAPVSFICALAAAAASYRWLEMPFLRLKERFAVVQSRAP